MAFIQYNDINEADQRSAELWQDVQGAGWQVGNITTRLYTTRQQSVIEGDDLPAGIDNAIQISARDAYLDALIVADDMETREIGEVAELYPAWAFGDTYAIDQIVQYEGDTWKCRQAHTAFDAAWSPPNVPALWLRYRKDADTTLEWVAGEPVSIGTLRTYNGNEYTCLQAHVTETTWQPPNVPALWAIVTEPTAEWGYPISYGIGDEVDYLGNVYRCLQAHTSIATWTPVAVPALWLAL